MYNGAVEYSHVHTYDNVSDLHLVSGSEARPAALAAQAYVAAHSDRILNGYDLQVQIMDTGCNAGSALFSYSDLQKLNPIGVVGGGCDATAQATQLVAATSKQVHQPAGLALFERSVRTTGVDRIRRYYKLTRQ